MVSCNDLGTMHELRRFFRANPQVLVLLIICLVLGLGTFLIVLFAIAGSGSGTNTGEPSGAVWPLLAAAHAHIGL